MSASGFEVTRSLSRCYACAHGAVARRVPESVLSTCGAAHLPTPCRFLTDSQEARFGNDLPEVTRFSEVCVRVVRPIIQCMKNPCTAGIAMKIFRPLLIAGLMLAHPAAHATSFDCHRGRSLTEQMICNDAALSKLDDTLGQLYWKARRRVVKRRAFLNDSDSKWAWREANCRDAACLETWYATRIDELQRLIDSMQTGTPLAPEPASPPPVAPAGRLEPATALAHAAGKTGMPLLQCTAANPGPVVNEQCSTVIRQTGDQWKYKLHGSDWFCGVAMVESSPQMQANAAQ
jgi:uncharacterized protein